MQLENKVAVVTGAGRGIGRAIALALAQNGAKVVAAARTQTEIDAAVQDIERIGGAGIAVPCDVSQESEVNTLISKTVQKFGNVDILINNAGIGTFAKIAETKSEDFERIWKVNMQGLFFCTRAVLPFMMKQGSGDIVNLASLAGRNAFVGGGAYCASKWALVGFSRCLMLEVREHNIRVITLCPGSVDTDFGGTGDHVPRPGVIPKAEDIAQVAVDTLCMPRYVMVSEVDIRPTNPKG